jgi:predicted AlkP superfamily phosphohydrolase/phosphomutase
MFFRYLYNDHPTNIEGNNVKFKDTIENIYDESDKLVGQVLEQIDKKDLLLVISDHGFKPFKWGVNLNTWLYDEGYLVLKSGSHPGNRWLNGVDWSKSKAFAFGLSGIFINTYGREKNGIVKPGNEKTTLLQELKEKLESLFDEENENRPIRNAIITSEALHGPYVSEAPDLLMGYENGYRASWNCAVGKITDDVIENNTRFWSGDHCVDPSIVPGVFFSNWKTEVKTLSICDIAPTVLDLFGIDKQHFHDGKNLELKP